MSDLYFKNNGIYNVHAIRNLYPSLSLPSELDATFISERGFKPVRIDEKPAITELQYPVKWDREEVNEYVQGWVMANKPAEVIAVQEENARLELDRNELKSDQLIQNFISKTPTDIITYINEEVTDLASAKQVLKLMARILLVIARREYR